ncbi:RES domain-containing protein [Methylobacterium sp. J-076]|uniref:RES domain-containing protein n=1 Tax=Methylobacterium sp. J-076 TaxID=2836655 RepID=UPI001FB93A8A|nr:RES domain-containing protein [Methylobacterium sp. J-076]MCJ2012429.1 RES domain-containing protein [Methylobacterium sp. J-076]
MVQTVTEAFPPLPLTEVVDLVNDFGGMTLAEKQASIERLVRVHPTLNMEWGPGWRYRRCRKLDPGVVPTHVDELIWRKGVPAQLGRANPEGYEVLYLADRRDTALNEARIARDPAVLAEFVIQASKSIRVAPIGEFAQVQRTGRGLLAGEASAALSNFLNSCSLPEAQSFLIADAFLLDCLVGHDDYAISSHVALCVFNKNPNVSAIAYPSRRQDGAINFAVRVEGFWDSWALASVSYGTARHLAMGYYDLPIAKAVDEVYGDGRLRWRDMPGGREMLLLGSPFIASVAT